MASPDVQRFHLSLTDGQRVSALLVEPAGTRACYVMAHGAGAGMNHPFLESMARQLGCRAIATLRFQFPYMENKSKRPDPPQVAQHAVRSALAEASTRFPRLPVFAGGKSFGGRMASQAQAAAPVEGVRGIIFLGFPLHPANQPSTDRGKHLDDVRIPMLFIQGERDALADLNLLQQVINRIGSRATLHFVPHADHSFYVPAKSGVRDSNIMTVIADAIEDWIDKLLSSK